MLQVLLTARYFPAVAEIREAAQEITRPPELSAAAAWGEIRRAIGHFGHGQPGEALRAMSPRTAAIVRAFGWESFCWCDLGELPAGLQAQIARIGYGGEPGRGDGKGQYLSVRWGGERITPCRRWRRPPEYSIAVEGDEGRRWADYTSQSAMRRRRPHMISQVQGGHCFYGCRRRPPLKGSLGGQMDREGKRK